MNKSLFPILAPIGLAIIVMAAILIMASSPLWISRFLYLGLLSGSGGSVLLISKAKLLDK